MAVRGGPARRIPMSPQTGVIREQARSARRPASRPAPTPDAAEAAGDVLAQRAADAAARAAAAEVRAMLGGLAAEVRLLREALERLDATSAGGGYTEPEQDRPEREKGM